MYYIEWDGVDPETGEQWQPTWVSPNLHSISKGKNAMD